jgi:catechol 2,3-dioxygenase-like lactoylglutathione lyase family enzyme
MSEPTPRLHHLALRTPDVSALVRFYQSWFGFAVLRDHSPRSVWLGLAGQAVLMIEQRAAGEPGVPAGTMELVAFHAQPEARAQLRSRLQADGLLEAETAHTLYFRDPDGRRVAISSYPFDGLA